MWRNFILSCKTAFTLLWAIWLMLQLNLGTFFMVCVSVTLWLTHLTIFVTYVGVWTLLLTSEPSCSLIFTKDPQIHTLVSFLFPSSPKFLSVFYPIRDRFSHANDIYDWYDIYKSLDLTKYVFSSYLLVLNHILMIYMIDTVHMQVIRFNWICIC